MESATLEEGLAILEELKQMEPRLGSELRARHLAV
jgi:hypothetical protein